MKNQLRIIGGEFKRRQLRFAAIDGLRPTPDRIRETLFNWLMWDIQAAKVLDVCAGSGALSFEALSRGAAQVVMIEPHATQYQFLKQNASLLKLSNVEIINQTAQRALAQRTDQFDLVFLDPPYALNLWHELAALIAPRLVANAWIYVEADREISQLQLPATWQLRKQTRAGLVHAALLQNIP